MQATAELSSIHLPCNRGARIRTGDLADPNGARYQAAPRPDAPTSIPHSYRRAVAAPLHEILAEIDGLLQPGRFEDYCFNGLQVPGPQRVSTIVTGVSAHTALFERAAAEQADLLLVHHGLLWGDGVRRIDALLGRRLRLLFDADIALAAYHLPLDAHAEIGNNALLARALGGEELEPFASTFGKPIGFIARLAGGGMEPEELAGRVENLTARPPLLLSAGPAGSARVERLAIVSGGGAGYLPEAAAAGAQALLTGEAKEPTMALARELGVHVIAAGHHATETFGVRALGERLADHFGVRHVFVEVANPV